MSYYFKQSGATGNGAISLPRELRGFVRYIFDIFLFLELSMIN